MKRLFQACLLEAFEGAASISLKNLTFSMHETCYEQVFISHSPLQYSLNFWDHILLRDRREEKCKFHYVYQWCRIIVPPELGYPENDYNKGGPRPMTFSVRVELSLVVFSNFVNQVWEMQCKFSLQGQRALDFVLKNQGLIDKTLLFDIELMKIIPNWFVKFSIDPWIPPPKNWG